jgi:hypothetical protein
LRAAGRQHEQQQQQVCRDYLHGQEPWTDLLLLLLLLRLLLLLLLLLLCSRSVGQPSFSPQ